MGDPRVAHARLPARVQVNPLHCCMHVPYGVCALWLQRDEPGVLLRATTGTLAAASHTWRGLTARVRGPLARAMMSRKIILCD